MTKTLDNSYTTQTEQDVYVNAEATPLYPNSENATNNSSSMNGEFSKTSSNNNNGARPSITTTTTVTHIPPPDGIKQPDLVQMKRDRKRAQTLGGWVGGALGFAILFIPGAIIGAIAGNKITKHHLKKEERQVKEDYEYRVSQLNAMRGSVAKAA